MKRRMVWISTLLLLLGLLTGCALPAMKPSQTEPPQASRRLTEPAATQKATTDDASVPATPAPDVDPAALSPLMWRVTDDKGHSLYLFGTIHVGDARNHTVMTRVSKTLDECDALAVEFDTVAYEEDLAAATADMMQYMLTDGSTIRDQMPEELYTRAAAALQEAGLFPALFQRYNLAMWSQLLDSAILLKYSELKPEDGMDTLLLLHAKEREMPIYDVESAAFQMALLNSFDEELYLMMIESTLDAIDSYAEDLNKLHELWLSGDQESFWSYLEEEDDETEYSEEQLRLLTDYNEKLLDERNRGMAEKAIEYLAGGETVFFAVGAAHMAGETGLVALLQDAGYTVEPFVY